MKRSIAPLLSLSALLAACSPEDTRPNVVLVTFDTTRADHMSCYGYDKETTPNLDQLAKDGQRFTNAYAVTSWTLPSHGSIFTGKFPSSHGAQYAEDGVINLVQEGGIKGPDGWSQYRANPFAIAETTLAAKLTEQGYATHAIVGGPWLKKVYGLGLGFEGYDDREYQIDANGTELNGRTAENITNHAIEFVDDHQDQPFFLFLNYYDPHGPYTPTPEYFKKYWKGPVPQRGSWPLLLAKYDAEIEYTDHHFGRLLKHLRNTGVYDNTIVVMTSDHGELMGDQGGLAGHGDSLSQPEIHIPLIIKGIGASAPTGVSSELVQQVDLMPSLLDSLGIQPVPGMQGHVIGRETVAFALAEINPLPFMTRQKNDPRQRGKFKVYIEGSNKLVWSELGAHQLYDLKADPGEIENLYAREPELAKSLMQKLEQAFDNLPEPGEVAQNHEQPTASDQNQLKSLGYTGDDEEDFPEAGQE